MVTWGFTDAPALRTPVYEASLLLGSMTATMKIFWQLSKEFSKLLLRTPSVDVPLLFCHKTCSAFITESSEPAQPTIVECSQTSRPQCLFSSPALRSRMIDAYLHLASHPAVPKREFRHWKRPTYLHKQLRQLQIKTNHKFLSL